VNVINIAADVIEIRPVSRGAFSNVMENLSSDLIR
jgi:hypothetical protein